MEARNVQNKVAASSTFFEKELIVTKSFSEKVLDAATLFYTFLASIVSCLSQKSGKMTP